MKTLYTTTRETVVERTPLPRAPRRPAPIGEPSHLDGYNAKGEHPIEMVLADSVTGVQQWPESSGKVLTICRTSPKLADLLRRVAEIH